MNKQETFFLNQLNSMLLDIEKSYVAENDPLRRCELAKGYLEIGKYLIGIDQLFPIEHKNLNAIGLAIHDNL